MKQFFSYLLLMFFLASCSTIGQNTPENTANRSTGTAIDDKTALYKVSRQLRKDGLKQGNHINATVFNEIALLTGEVRTKSQRTQTSESVNKIRHIRKIHNQLAISAPSSISTRISDSATTTLVKTALLRHPDVRGHKIKVVTERGNVYLMGLVTAAEADAASNAARKVRGVRKVVRLFEIVNET